tara:strand:+ start:4444 stop:5364 length:921 start_codon:yes stop_codon:yes gene_type:complete
VVKLKIGFFSETGTNQKYPRDFPNARTEVGWCLALDSPMCSLTQLPNEKFDLGIVIVPKTNPNVDLNHIRKVCDKVAVMQEGPHWYFQDYTIDKQFHYYNTLMSADWVYCHNESDVNYYKGLGCTDVRVMQSLMIPEGLVSRSEWGNGTIIGGNFVSWYGGFDSYMVAREIGNPIVAPSMGRKQELESQIEDIQYLPYMSWRDWISNLGQYNIGIHLMRTHAAGTFAMNCGFHGIPCIGYKGLDTQQIIHPNTTITVGDLDRAKEIALRLNNDEEFYKYCSKEALYKFSEYYTEEKWLKKWKRTNK